MNNVDRARALLEEDDTAQSYTDKLAAERIEHWTRPRPGLLEDEEGGERYRAVDVYVYVEGGTSSERVATCKEDRLVPPLTPRPPAPPSPTP